MVAGLTELLPDLLTSAVFAGSGALGGYTLGFSWVGYYFFSSVLLRLGLGPPPKSMASRSFSVLPFFLLASKPK